MRQIPFQESHDFYRYISHAILIIFMLSSDNAVNDEGGVPFRDILRYFFERIIAWYLRNEI